MPRRLFWQSKTTLTTAKARQVIADALARAMYDAPLYLLTWMNKDGFTHSHAMEIARRMVRELDHAGYTLKRPSAAAVRELEDQICMGLSTAECARLGLSVAGVVEAGTGSRHQVHLLSAQFEEGRADAAD